MSLPQNAGKVGKTIVLHSIFTWAWLKKWLTRKIAWFHIPPMANKLWVRYHPNDLNRSHVRILNLSLWHKWPREETPHPWLQLQWPRWLTGDLRWYTQCHKHPPPICRVHTTHLWSYWGWFTIEVTTLPDDHVKNTVINIHSLYIYIYNFDILISSYILSQTTTDTSQWDPILRGKNENRLNKSGSRVFGLLVHGLVLMALL